MSPLLVGNLKSRTSWVALLLVIFGTLNSQADVFKDILPGKWAGIVIALIGIVVLVLRNLTTESIIDKGTPDAPTPPAPPSTGSVTPKVVSLFAVMFLAVTVVGVTALPGCAAFGISQQKPLTFKQQLEAAYLTVDGAQKTVKTLLQAGVIGSADAQNVANQLNNVVDGLNIARTLAASDAVGGNTKLTQVITTMQAALDYLAAKQQAKGN